jgi:hypothetical protein
MSVDSNVPVSATTALKNVLEPIFEEIFLPQSHGYRPNTDAHAAVRKGEAYLEMVIKSINLVIRGWGNYFKCGTVKKSFGELDGYIRGRLRSFQAKKRTLKVLVFGIHHAEFAKLGLVSLSSMLDDTISCNGIRQTKAAYGKSVRAL